METEISGKFLASKSAGEVSSLLIMPENPMGLLLLAHGAGAPMHQAHMQNIAMSLSREKIATFRFNFPFTEKSKKRIDPRPIIFKTIESAFQQLRNIANGLAIFAGGHSFGGRMISTLVSNGGLQEINGIIFFSFPLHPPGKRSIERAEHLARINKPQLFLSGTRDRLAELDLLKAVCAKQNSSTLHTIETADHSFMILKRERKSTEDVYQETALVARNWMKNTLKAPTPSLP